jgi:hypothetical protein
VRYDEDNAYILWRLSENAGSGDFVHTVSSGSMHIGVNLAIAYHLLLSTDDLLRVLPNS